jgi:hypothetical protein
MAMARAYWRATHHPVALVFTADRRFSVIVVGQAMGFLGGLNVSHAAEALVSETCDLGPFRDLERAFLTLVD